MSISHAVSLLIVALALGLTVGVIIGALWRGRRGGWPR